MGKFNAQITKVQLKLAINRLKLIQNKKQNLAKQHKHEIAALIQQGKDESARIRVENVIREDLIIEAYELIELFCELIQARLPLLDTQSDVPPELKEAICTLVYCAPRCADIPELATLRDQFGFKYGREFLLAANANKNDCVNARVVHKLNYATPEQVLVIQYLSEIAKSHGLPFNPDGLSTEVLKFSKETTTSVNTAPPANMPPVQPAQPGFPPAGGQLVFPPGYNPQFPGQPTGYPPGAFPPGAFPPGGYGFPPGGYSFPPPGVSPVNPGAAAPSKQTSQSNIPPPFGMNEPPPSISGSLPSVPNGKPGSSGKDDDGDGGDGGDNAPDFDELTARFEALKKRG
jgi:vacuolar protein sorting-associated protein IST1